MHKGTLDMWNNRSDEYYGGLRGQLDRLIKNPSWAFPPLIWDMIHREFPDLRGKRVLVPSSGDNFAVFGFHLLGAEITSCDFAERQLYNAQKVADEQSWSIKFVQQDSMELNKIGDGDFDLVYTSNGVHVWISDLPKMYGNFHRVLKPGGVYIMFETHPFIRPFDSSGAEIKVKKPYTSTGPFVSSVTEYAWRVMDLFNSLFDAGFTMTHMEEIHSDKDDYDNWFSREADETDEQYANKYDWKHNPWAALPQWIGFTAKKEGKLT